MSVSPIFPKLVKLVKNSEVLSALATNVLLVELFTKKSLKELIRDSKNRISRLSDYFRIDLCF